MSLQRMARKAKASKRTNSEEMRLADNENEIHQNNNQPPEQVL